MSLYAFSLRIPSSLPGEEGISFSREELVSSLMNLFTEFEVQGVEEGFVSSDQRKLELDAGIAPRDRDWVSEESESLVTFYFSSMIQAQDALDSFLHCKVDGIQVEKKPAEIPNQDWNEEWKKSFQGVDIPPNWRVLPPHAEKKEEDQSRRVLKLIPGAGFGTGTHETTALCLEHLTGFLDTKTSDQKSKLKLLDFGSGSGVLTVASGLMGVGYSLGIEIDELAVENAIENRKLNSISQSVVEFSLTFEDAKVSSKSAKESMDTGFDLVVANILKPVLLQYAETLGKFLKKDGFLFLSGLMKHDLEEIITTYERVLGKKCKNTWQKQEWYCLQF